MSAKIVLIDKTGRVTASVAEGCESKFWEVFGDRFTSCIWCGTFVAAGTESKHACMTGDRK